MRKLFPIIYPGSHRFNVEVGRLRGEGLCAFMIAVPWKMLEAHADTVSRNHNVMSLSSLADPGLSALQVCAILEDRDPYNLRDHIGADQAVHHARLLNHLLIWDQLHGGRP